MELQGDIMNIPVNRDKMFNAIYESLSRDGGHDMCELAYKLGHRDARHGASELAIAHAARIRAEARAEAIEECIDYLADRDLIGHDGAWAQSIRSNLLSGPKEE